MQHCVSRIEKPIEESDDHSDQWADRAAEVLHELGFEVAGINANSIYGLAAKATFVVEDCDDCSDDLTHVLASSFRVIS